MADRWWQRLPAAERREYERSETMARVPLSADARFGRVVDGLADGLARADRESTQRAAQALADLVCRGLSIRPPEITVFGKRPPDGEGELHGIYRPAGGRAGDRISVWMRTAKQDKVVAVRTFLRTLLHELGHHIDMRRLDLPNSYHTKGFYQRESSLFRLVTQGSHLADGTAPSARKAHAPPAPPPPPAPADVQRGLALLRAAADQIRARPRGSR